MRVRVRENMCLQMSVLLARAHAYVPVHVRVHGSRSFPKRVPLLPASYTRSRSHLVLSLFVTGLSKTGGEQP